MAFASNTNDAFSVVFQIWGQYILYDRKYCHRNQQKSINTNTSIRIDCIDSELHSTDLMPFNQMMQLKHHIQYLCCLFTLSVPLVYLCLSPLLDIVDFSSLATAAYCWFSLTATHCDSATVSSHANKALFSGVKLTNRGMENTEMDWRMKAWRDGEMENWDRGDQERDDPEATGKSAGARLQLANTHAHTCQNDSYESFLQLCFCGGWSRRKTAPSKESITFRSDDVTLMSGLGQHEPK